MSPPHQHSCPHRTSRAGRIWAVPGLMRLLPGVLRTWCNSPASAWLARPATEESMKVRAPRMPRDNKGFLFEADDVEVGRCREVRGFADAVAHLKDRSS